LVSLFSDFIFLITFPLRSVTVCVRVCAYNFEFFPNYFPIDGPLRFVCVLCATILSSYLYV
jgi:hypothetical protein